MSDPRARLRTFGLSVLVLCVLTVLLHREVLLGGAVYHMDDAADNYYPARVAFKRALLRDGVLPSWEPGSLCGWPLLADPYYGYFYPLNFVFYLRAPAGVPSSDAAGLAGGVPLGLGYSAALHMLLGGIGMLLFLRRRTSPMAALYGATAFALSSFLVVRIRHIIFIQLAAWLPWLLWAIDDYVQTRRRAALVRCGVFTALVLIVGAHSLLHFAALLLGGYAVARLMSAALAEPPGARLRFFVRTGGALAVAAGLGALCAMLALLPTLLAMPSTARALGTDYHFASSYAWPGWRYVYTLFIPDVFGPGEWRGAPWFARWNHWEMAGYYQGAAALLLLLPGAFAGLRQSDRQLDWKQSSRTRLQLERPALFLLCGLGLLAALGDAGPVHPLLYRYAPLYAALRCPARGLFVLVVAGPILAAWGADHILSGAPGPSRRRWWRAVGAAVLAAALGVGASLLLTRTSARLAPNFAQAARAAAHFCWVLGLFGGLLLLRLAVPRRGALLLGLLVVLTAADQLPIDRGYVQPHPASFAYGTEHFAAVGWLLAQPPAAVSTEPPGEPLYDRLVSDPRGPFRLLSIGETIGRESAAGYGSIQIWRYVHLLYIINHGKPYPHRALKDDVAAGTIWQLNSPLVDVLNVRYLIGPTAPGPKWQERFRPAAGAPPQAVYEAAWDAQLAVFENAQVMPRAFVAYQARSASSAAEEAALVARPDFDPHREIVVGAVTASGDKVATPTVENKGRLPTPARLLSHHRQHVVIEAEAQAAGVLTLGDAFYPGWTATVDGHPAPIVPVDLALRGVALPPGRHRVEMSYRDPALRPGGVLSLLGLCGLLLLSLTGALGRRRDGAGGQACV